MKYISNIFEDFGMSPVDIAKMTPRERLDLIGALWDSLNDADVTLTEAQEAELARRMEIFEREQGDLAWAKPYVDEADAEIERGASVTLEEHEARMDALLVRFAAK
jgi:putative addiction module component (TIGR02574 family)